MSVSKFDTLGTAITMHKKILSEKERELLSQFLKNGEKGEGFRMLKLRIKRNFTRLFDDFELIRKAKDHL